MVNNLQFQETVLTLVITVIGDKPGRCMASQDSRKLDRSISDQCTYPGLPRHQVLAFILFFSFIEIPEVYLGRGGSISYYLLLFSMKLFNKKLIYGF